MSRSKKLWLLGCVIGLIVLIISSVALIIGTQSGTRWLLGMAKPYLPSELALGDAHGTLLGGLHLDSLEFRSEAALVTVQSLELDIELLPLFQRHVMINEFKVKSVDVRVLETVPPDGTDDSPGVPDIDLPVDLSVVSATIKNVSVSGREFERQVETIDLSAALRGNALTVDSLIVRSDWLRLEISGRARLQNRYPSELRAKWRWTPADSQHLAGDIGIKGDLRGYEIQHQLSEPVSISTTGRVRVEAGEWFADLVNQWQQVSWIVAERPVRTSGGTLSLQGNDAGFSVVLDTIAQFDEFPESRLVMEGDATLQGMHISGLTVANDLVDASIRGDVRWAPSPSMEIELDISGGDFNSNPVSGNAQIEYADDTLMISDADFQIGSNRISGVASIDEMLKIEARVELPKIAELLTGVTGALAGEVFIDGPRQQPSARAEVTGSGLAWGDYSAESLSASVSYSANSNSNATLDLEQVAVSERPVESVSVSISGLMQQHKLRATLHSHGNRLQVDADGAYADSSWAGRIGSVSVSGSALGDWQTRQPSELMASKTEIRLSELCLFGPSGDENACVSAEYQIDGPASFTASISELPLTALPLNLPEDVKLDGSINIRGNGKFDNERLSGDATVELLDTMATATIDDEVVSVSLAEAKAQASVIENKLDLMTRLRLDDGIGDGNLQLAIENVADIGSGIDGSAMVSLSDAAAFAVFLPSITNLHGKVDGSLAISGSLREPQFSGEIAVREGRFGVRPAGVEISDIEVRLRQLDAGQLQFFGSARSGEGQISIEGSTQVSAETGIRSEISLSGNNFELLRLPDWQVAASPEILVVFDEKTARVSGELGIPTARINVKSVPESAESPSPDATVHRAQGADPHPGRRIEVDIETVLGDDVQLTGFGLTTSIDGAVNLRGGTAKSFTGFGRLSLREGRYKAYGQELEIDRGELIFNGPLDNPTLDIRAVRKIQNITAGIQLTGTANELQSEVFSEPPLGDAEVLSYLLTGRPLASVNTSEEGAALNNAAFALGLSQAGSVVSQIRGQLGLETLTVEGGADSGRIIAGKRVGTRLLVEYGYGLVDKLGTLLLRYQLTKRFVLESRTGTVSNFDIVYSVKKP